MVSPEQPNQEEPLYFTPVRVPVRLGFFESLYLRLNAKLVTVADVQIAGIEPEDVSAAELLANLDVSGYLIIFISLVAIVVAAIASGLFFVSLAEKFPFLSLGERAPIVIFIAVVPSLFTGIEVCHLLFRFRRWIRS